MMLNAKVFSSQSLVALEFREQVVQGAVAGVKLCMGVVVVAEVAPCSTIGQRWEHLTTGGGWSTIEESEVVAIATFIDIHGIVCESLVKLCAWRGLWDAAWSSMHRVWSDLLWEGVVVEVEAVVAAKVVRRNAFIEGAAIQLQTGRRCVAGVAPIIAHGWCDRETREVHVIEVEVHIEVTSKVRRRLREGRSAVIAWAGHWRRHRLTA